MDLQFFADPDPAFKNLLKLPYKEILWLIISNKFAQKLKTVELVQIYLIKKNNIAIISECGFGSRRENECGSGSWSTALANSF